MKKAGAVLTTGPGFGIHSWRKQERKQEKGKAMRQESEESETAIENAEEETEMEHQRKGTRGVMKFRSTD